MKIKLSIFFIVLWFSSTALGDEKLPAQPPVAENPPVSSQWQNKKAVPPKQGETIWLEEKIAPSTQWLENLVKPLGIWIERKIQRIHPSVDDEISNHWSQPKTTQPNELNIPSNGFAISKQKAASIAKQQVAGDVLRVKLLLSKGVAQYRVKLISRTGEIHLFYINAETGALILPTKNSSAE